MQFKSRGYLAEILLGRAGIDTPQGTSASISQVWERGINMLENRMKNGSRSDLSFAAKKLSEA